MVRKSKLSLKLPIAAIMLSILLVLAACSSGAPSGGGGAASPAQTPEPNKPAGKLPTINVAYMPDMNGATPIVIGEEKGYFKEAGINVNAVKFLSGPPEFQAMASGDIDIAYIGPGATFLAAQGKGHIIDIVSLGKSDMVFATKKSGIKEWKDLKGKTVGVPKGTSGEMVLNLGLEKGGLKPSDVNIVNMDVAGAVSAYVAGKVDAVAIWSPYTQEIEKQVGKENMVKLGDNSDFFPDYIFPASWVVNPKFFQEKPELVQQFLKAIAQTTDYKLKNKDEAIKMTAAYTQVPEESLKLQLDSLEWLDNKRVADAFKDGTAKKWYENLEKLFVQNGSLKEVVPADQFIVTDPFLKATSQ
ncbi:aliphatic sulfonate ABC transporter substrate-binding protein [Paenibacillus doosanensis]|uniref:ABC transporter substrate-binding protein n=1 Tax=Paenibacillus doosanensis TaxID=1229154 RepID=UPI00217FF240|nr:aliphatic sulfonate ABC transporter substrate-binding protein [Paenibacillus doosanensis]MCS7461700.1 aliphatic sulfonate ABC transporter substrate-binding protein [Paenibacillus doosanensis]